MNVGDITILSLQFHSNGSFRAITMQNPFTCVLSIPVPTVISFTFLKIQNRKTVIKPITHFLFLIRKWENGFIPLFCLPFLTFNKGKR